MARKREQSANKSAGRASADDSGYGHNSNDAQSQLHEILRSSNSDIVASEPGGMAQRLMDDRRKDIGRKCF